MTFVQAKIDEVLAYLGGDSAAPGQEIEHSSDDNSNPPPAPGVNNDTAVSSITHQQTAQGTLHSQHDNRVGANSPKHQAVGTVVESQHTQLGQQQQSSNPAQHAGLSQQVVEQAVSTQPIAQHVPVPATTQATSAVQELPQTVPAVSASPQMLHKPNYRPVHNLRPPRIITEHFDLGTYKVDSAHGYVEADCRHCSHTIKGQRNVTSNFIQHIKRKHPEAYEQFTANSASRSKRPRLSAVRTESNLVASVTTTAPPPPPASSGTSTIGVPAVELAASTAPQAIAQVPNELTMTTPRGAVVVASVTDSGTTAVDSGLPMTTTPMNGSVSVRNRHSGNNKMGRTNIRERIPVANVVSSIQAAASVSPDITLEKSLVSPTYRGAVVTDCEYAAALSDRLKCHVYIKREDCQPSGSPVFRAAYNYIASTPTSRSGVVVGMPSAPAVALAAQKNNKPCIAYVPENTPSSVVRFLEKNGANVNVAGRTNEESCRMARSKSTLINRTYMDLAGKTLLTGYAEATAGYATLALEILQNLPMVNKVFMAAGNALMFSGVSAILQRLGRDVKLIGVQLADPCHSEEDTVGAMDVDDPVDSSNETEGNDCTTDVSGKGWIRGQGSGSGVGDDGIEPDFADEGDWGAFVAETVTVTRKEASIAVRTVFEDCEGLVLSLFGALSVAGAEKLWRKDHAAHQSYVCVVSDPLRDFDALRMVAGDCFRYDTKHHFSIVDCSTREVNGFVRLMSGLCGQTENRTRILKVEFNGEWPIKLGVAVGNYEAYKSVLESMGFSIKTDERKVNEVEHRGSAGISADGAAEEESIVAYSMRLDEKGRLDVAQLLAEIGQCGEVRTVRYERDGSGIARVHMSWRAQGVRREVLEQEMRSRVMSFRRVDCE